MVVRGVWSGDGLLPCGSIKATAQLSISWQYPWQGEGGNDYTVWQGINLSMASSSIFPFVCEWLLANFIAGRSTRPGKSALFPQAGSDNHFEEFLTVVISLLLFWEFFVEFLCLLHVKIKGICLFDSPASVAKETRLQFKHQ